MSNHFRGVSLGTALSIVLVLGIPSLLAEDSNVFENRADITLAQRVLVQEGYLDAASFTSGVLDPATRKALAVYQSRHALNDTGTLDDDTYQMLGSHEFSYPWGGVETMPVSAAEPVEPVPAARALESVSSPRVAEAAPVPEPTPSAAEVKEASAPASTPEAERTMPTTGTPLPLLLLAGVVLLGAGALVLRFRKA